jgi:hypothetical protein
MRRSLLVLPSALLLLLAAAPARAADAPKGPWDGFGVGSSVTTKTTTKMSMPGVPEQAMKSRMTLVKVTDDAYVLEMENEVAGQWNGQEITIPRKAPTGAGAMPEAKFEELGEEKVTVEGKEYACKKRKAVMAGATTITWTHDTHGVLKMEGTMPGDTSTTMTVTRLEAKATVAGKELTCREERSVMKSPQGETTSTSLTSTAVPGFAVRSETKMAMGPVETTTLTEVVEFTAKHAVVTTK